MRSSNRLGCFSGVGIITGVITALLITGYVYATGGILFSPGPLSAKAGELLGDVTSHAEIGGNCKACHAALWESTSMDDRCMTCHEDIKSELQNTTSLHGSLMHDQPDLTCRYCHLDHRGANAQLTLIDTGTFPHDALGFALTGSHVQLQCEACHQNNQFTGLSGACAGCHADPVYHVGMFGLDCATCHNTDDWSARYTGPHPAIADEGGRGINHGRVECRVCHTQNLRTATCTACHGSNNPEGGEHESEGEDH